VEIRAEEPPQDLFSRPSQPMHESRGELVESEDGAAPANGSLPARPVSQARNTLVDPNDPATWKHAPRNGPCPCGSGKKYKYCHGK
jgi:preprotein translocase subunit SecA